MPVEFTILKSPNQVYPELDKKVLDLASSLKNNLQEKSVDFDRACVLGASSSVAQSVIMPSAERLGFASEKKGLFSEYSTSALRPDFFLPVHLTGVLLEVERGKTLRNNMDLLDLWKTHICANAHFLFLFVPFANVRSSGRERVYETVITRLESFFTDANSVNVDAAYIFGYGPK